MKNESVEGRSTTKKMAANEFRNPAWSIKIRDKKVADVSQYVRRNFGPRQSNAFQNGKDNNQVEKYIYIF